MLPKGLEALTPTPLRPPTPLPQLLLLLCPCSWCSLPQKDILGQRSSADGAKFGRALDQMGSLYASLTATVVLQLQDMADPRQPAHTSLEVAFGSVIVVRIAAGQLLESGSDMSNDLSLGLIACGGTLELPQESEREAQAAKATLDSRLPADVTAPRVVAQAKPIGAHHLVFDVRQSSFLALIEALLRWDGRASVGATASAVGPGRLLHGELRLRYESAEGARTAMRAVQKRGLTAYSLYNDRPYAARGWPTFESGAATLAEAHLKQEAQQDQGAAQRDSLFSRAKQSFASKLHPIGSGDFARMVPTEKLNEGPEAVLQVSAGATRHTRRHTKPDTDSHACVADRHALSLTFNSTSRTAWRTRRMSSSRAKLTGITSSVC